MLWILVLTAFLAGCSGSHPSEPDSGPDDGELKVLFIGHSLTSWFDMPQIFATLAETGGHPVHVRMAVRGNATLEDHLADDGTLALIAQEPWDVVALQGASYRVAFDGLVWELLDRYQQMEALIRASNPEALILINMWFPPQDGDTLAGTWYPFL
jgi:hypothetical protein